jgi:predicted small metal-binding protein
MKASACGDVVRGCQAKWVCSTDEELLAEAARHARVDHGMTDIPPELVDQVRARIVPVA